MPRERKAPTRLEPELPVPKPKTKKKSKAKATPAKKGKKTVAKKAEGKKVKDPNAPKKNLSAYMFFTSANREKIKAQNKDATFGELGKIMGSAWREMSDKDKKPYEKKAEADKARYVAAMKKYKK